MFHSIYIKIDRQAFGNYLNTEKCGEVLEITEKREILQFKGDHDRLTCTF